MRCNRWGLLRSMYQRLGQRTTPHRYLDRLTHRQWRTRADQLRGQPDSIWRRDDCQKPSEQLYCWYYSYLLSCMHSWSWWREDWDWCDEIGSKHPLQNQPCLSQCQRQNLLQHLNGKDGCWVEDWDIWRVILWTSSGLSRAVLMSNFVWIHIIVNIAFR